MLPKLVEVEVRWLELVLTMFVVEVHERLVPVLPVSDEHERLVEE